MSSVLLLVPLGAWGCSDELPTAGDGGLIPVNAETVELRIPFSDFAADFQVFGGFGSAADVAAPLLALDSGFEARPLARFGRLPVEIFVIPEGGGATRGDTAFTPFSGTVVLFFDSLSAEGEAPFQLEPMVVESAWDVRSTNWEFAVDTLGERTAWGEPGGGPLTSLGMIEWDPAEGDSVTVQVDSLTVNRWADTTRADRGVLVRATQEGTHLRLRNAALRVMTRSEINPDTAVQVSALGGSFTTLYDPGPELSTEVFTIGGAPARRATFRMTAPRQVEGNPETCARVSCPIAITRDRILYAGIGFQSRTGSIEPLQPRDTLAVDLRLVLAPERLPRSPLGRSVRAAPTFVPPERFGAGGEGTVEIPITLYFRDLLRPAEDGFVPPPSSLAFLAALEPTPLWFGSFHGPGTEKEPYLRLILTFSEGVPLP